VLTKTQENALKQTIRILKQARDANSVNSVYELLSQAKDRLDRQVDDAGIAVWGKKYVKWASVRSNKTDSN
jgi:hypothetical protein